MLPHNRGILPWLIRRRRVEVLLSYGSKTIAYKIAAAREIASRAFSTAPAVAAELEADLLLELAPGEAANLSVGLLQQLIGRSVAALAEKMRELHEHHHHSRALEQHERAKVRAAAVVLRDHLREVRFLFDRHFGVRQGVANFEGRHDLMRLPMHSLERVCVGLKQVLEDERFGWRTSRYALEAEWITGKLGRLLADYQEAQAACRASRGRRAHAAAARERGIAECEQRIARMTAFLRQMCEGAGLGAVARGLGLRPPASRRTQRRAAGKSAARVAPLPTAGRACVLVSQAGSGRKWRRRSRRRRAAPPLPRRTSG